MSCVRAHPGRTGEGSLAASLRDVCPAPSARLFQVTSYEFSAVRVTKPRKKDHAASADARG
eukprot:5193558-Prymnesium_polylepis.1